MSMKKARWLAAGAAAVTAPAASAAVLLPTASAQEPGTLAEVWRAGFPTPTAATEPGHSLLVDYVSVQIGEV
ncbi:hypothetical protein ACFV0Z_24915 [Streptomyces xiamenensis]|uniref:hypothetical protein n=1 Tax=Streptomyces xiamenensis TaxID=408015 RepID=UPI0036869766